MSSEFVSVFSIDVSACMIVLLYLLRASGLFVVPPARRLFWFDWAKRRDGAKLVSIAVLFSSAIMLSFNDITLLPVMIPVVMVHNFARNWPEIKKNAPINDSGREIERYFDLDVIMREYEQAKVPTDFSQHWGLACERNGLVAQVGNGESDTLRLVSRGEDHFVVDPLGFTREEIDRVLPRLSVSMGTKLYDVDEISGGLLKISHTNVSLPREIGIHDVPEFGDSVVFGMSVKGWMSKRPEDWPHMLVCGTTGSGKSVFLRYLILQFVALYRDALIYIASPKLQRDFGMFKHPRIKTAIAAEFGDMLLELETERNRRENFPERQYPHVFPILDEYKSLLTTENVGTVNKIVTMSRSANFHCVFAAQRPTVVDRNIGAGADQIIANLEQRICFRVKNPLDSEKVVGSKLAFHLPRIPGRAVYDDNGHSTEIQVPFASDGEIEKIINSITC